MQIGNIIIIKRQAPPTMSLAFGKIPLINKWNWSVVCLFAIISLMFVILRKNNQQPYSTQALTHPSVRLNDSFDTGNDTGNRNSTGLKLKIFDFKNKTRDLIESTETSYTKDKMCTNDQRINYLNHMCGKEKNPFPSGGTRLVVDDKKKLMMCEISKSGCTSWKALWLHANINKNKKNLTNIPFKYKGQNIHDSDVMTKYGLNLILSEQILTMEYNGYTKFLVVRNPFDRIVSAYYNLIHWNEGLGDAGPLIVPFFRVLYPHLNHNVSDLKFEQFIEVITNPSSSIYNNRHWIPYSQTCQPCSVHYDYIIRIETMGNNPENDALPILSRLGYDSSIFTNTHLNNKSRREEQTSNLSPWSKHLPLFKSLSKRLLRRVYERYRLDMQLFGYTMNDAFHGNCDIDDGVNSCC